MKFLCLRRSLNFGTLAVTGVVSVAAGQDFVVPVKQDGRLVDLFQAGLHLRYVRGMENTSLNAFDVSIQFSAPGFLSPKTFFDDLEVFVYREGKLAEMVAHTRTPMTIDDARELGRKWGAPEAEMEEFLATVAANPVAYRGSRWGWPLLKTPRMGAGFRRSFSAEKPLLFQVTAGWDIPRIEAKTYREPIQPPEGFEHLSLEPLPFGPKEDPDGAMSSNHAIPDSPSGASPVVAETVPGLLSSRAWLKWFLPAVLLLAIVIALCVLSRRSLWRAPKGRK